MIDKKNIQLIIPMAGDGTRFRNSGYTELKPLINVDGMPIIQHVLNLFPGVLDVTFICNEQHIIKTNIKNILKNICPSCKIYSVGSHKKGPVYTVSKIFNQLDDNKETIISYCDYGAEWDFDAFLIEARRMNIDGSIPCYIGFHPHMLKNDNYAFCKENNGILVEIKEKESFTNNKMNEYASNGTYYFKRGDIVKKYFQTLMDMNIDVKGEYYISLVYNLLIRDKLKISIFPINKMLQWGTPHDLENYKYWSGYFKSITYSKEKINNPPDTTLILPMAGQGSRFKNEGFDIPKPLININGEPMVIQAVKCLPCSKKNLFICLDKHKNEYDFETPIKQYNSNSEIISIKNVTRGQAETCQIGILQNKIDLNSPILISASDNGAYYNSEEYKKLLNDNSIDIIVWTFRNNQTSYITPNSYSWVDVDENNFAKHISCKKFIYNNPLKTHAIIGTMFFRKAKYFIDGFELNYFKNITTNGEFYVDDVLNRNIESGLKVKVFEVDYYICWGTPNDYRTYLYWRDFFQNCKWHPFSNKL
jgi:bifunctional N-acetylglucosamine-1-phosphate-uridyltransferase/glucosamine-1-phosphate-acetyltransferase GlmU-like protein